MTKTKIVLAAVLFAATSSAAFAQFDPDLANRYPGYAASKSQTMTTRNVGLGAGHWTATQSPTFDRASNPNAGGV
jgi:hypothetical protein